MVYILYELYKIDWKTQHITPEIEMKSYKDFYKEDDNFFHYRKYVENVGYSNGECYVSFSEFMNNEYLDEEYMKELLNDDELYNEYLEDIKKRK